MKGPCLPPRRWLSVLCGLRKIGYWPKNPETYLGNVKMLPTRNISNIVEENREKLGLENGDWLLFQMVLDVGKWKSVHWPSKTILRKT